MAKSILARVQKLAEHYRSGDIPVLAQHEVNPNLKKGSRENYLYFTLAPCLNFQRSSPALWRAANATYQDPKTNFVFFPEKVIKVSDAELKAALVKHSLAVQTNKHPFIWRTITTSLYDHYSSDPRKIIKAGNADLLKILNLVQVEQKTLFPYLSGPKLSNYWLFILAHFTDIKLKNLQDLSIIPDTHSIKSSINLGLVSEDASPIDVDLAWRELLKGSDFTPLEMHSVLWNWSRNNFLPEV